MKAKGVKSLIAAAAVSAAALFAAGGLLAAKPNAATPAFANSAMRFEYGVTSSGMVVRNENSVIGVESEKLTFDIPDFPTSGGEKSYRSTVTAEYKFVNPTENQVNLSLAFPLGGMPDYFIAADNLKPHIYADGTEIPVQTRHTYSTDIIYGGDFIGDYDFGTEVKKISDEWYSDGFYNVDLPVTKYTMKIDRTGLNSNAVVECAANLNCDKTKVRYITDIAGCDSVNLYFYGGKTEREFYVLGDPTAYTINWQTGVRDGSSNNTKVQEVPYTVTETASTTLKELALTNYSAKSGISELDWYNGAVSGLSQSVSPCTTSYFGQISERNFLIWYLYELQFEPNAKITNKVVSPIYPSISGNDGDRFYYQYYLSPAKSWASFGTLEVLVKTDFELTTYNSNLSLEKCADGYRATFLSLPQQELRFELTDEGYHFWGYSYERAGVDMTPLAFIILFGIGLPSLAGFIVGIVFLAKNRKS